MRPPILESLKVLPSQQINSRARNPNQSLKVCNYFAINAPQAVHFKHFSKSANSSSVLNLKWNFVESFDDIPGKRTFRCEDYRNPQWRKSIVPRTWTWSALPFLSGSFPSENPQCASWNAMNCKSPGRSMTSFNFEDFGFDETMSWPSKKFRTSWNSYQIFV